MTAAPLPNGIRVFSTCPPSNLADQHGYLDLVAEVARWSERAGCEGILVYTDNGLVDPWLASQVIVDATERLCPLVAVQPVYMHPYSVAKMVATFGFLHGRRLYLNMVAGGFKNDLEALGDPTPHDERYTRLVEFTTIVVALLRGEGAVTHQGRYYRVVNLKMTPPLPPELAPGVFISGSSEAGLEAARALGATAIQYPQPVQVIEAGPGPDVADAGIRIGIVARDDPAAAWCVARERFPEDRKGQLLHQLAMKVSDSTWHKQISVLGESAEEPDSPYWTVPFQNYKTFCPYLVGGYERVALEVARYMRLGYRTFIIDVPASPDELGHISEVFRRAARQVA